MPSPCCCLHFSPAQQQQQQRSFAARSTKAQQHNLRKNVRCRLLQCMHVLTPASMCPANLTATLERTRMHLRNEYDYKSVFSFFFAWASAGWVAAVVVTTMPRMYHCHAVDVHSLPCFVGGAPARKTPHQWWLLALRRCRTFAMHIMHRATMVRAICGSQAKQGLPNIMKHVQDTVCCMRLHHGAASLDLDCSISLTALFLVQGSCANLPYCFLGSSGRLGG